MLYSINWPNFIVWIVFTAWDIGKHVFQMLVSHVEINFPDFEINFDFLIKQFFYISKKSRQ